MAHTSQFGPEMLIGMKTLTSILCALLLMLQACFVYLCKLALPTIKNYVSWKFVELVGVLDIKILLVINLC